MEPVLVFFGVAVLVGCVIAALVRHRLHAAEQRPDASDEELCQLRQARKISSTAVAASLVGLAVAALALAVL